MTRRRLGLGLLTAALAAVPVSAGAMEGGTMHGADAPEAHGAAVSVSFATFAPATVDVLTGETVTWTNNSVRVHTVTADDGAFDSDRLTSSSSFSQVFPAEGIVGYHCRIHAGMAGIVAVYTVLLDAPTAPGAPGRAYPLSGRAALPAGTDVGIEADSGDGFRPAGHAVVGADGSFRTQVVPTTTARYRAVAPGTTSPAVQLLVLDHRVGVRVRALRGRRVQVDASVTPAAAGAPVVLQLYLPEHFGWWPVRKQRLDRHSAARFVLALHRRVPARVVLTLPDGATPLAMTPVRRIGRPAR